MSRRAQTEQFLLQFYEDLAPGNPNVEIYRQQFAAMDDDAFASFMADIKAWYIDGNRGVPPRLVYTEPPFSKTPLSVARNLAIADRYKHSFFQKVWVGAHQGVPRYLTNIPYLVFPIPYRRPAQFIEKKLSVPEHSRSRDRLSGQVTGASKSSALSYVEVGILSTMPLDHLCVEFLKYRGGDERGQRALFTSLATTGTASLAQLQNYASGVRSIHTLNALFAGMHLRANF